MSHEAIFINAMLYFNKQLSTFHELGQEISYKAYFCSAC